MELEISIHIIVLSVVCLSIHLSLSLEICVCLSVVAFTRSLCLSLFMSVCIFKCLRMSSYRESPEASFAFRLSTLFAREGECLCEYCYSPSPVTLHASDIYSFISLHQNRRRWPSHYYLDTETEESESAKETAR